jgi:hypothetical protein
MSDVLRTGDAVFIQCRGSSAPGKIMLASSNGKSLMLAFDAMLDGHLGMMPVLMNEQGEYRALVTDALVTVTKQGSEAMSEEKTHDDVQDAVLNGVRHVKLVNPTRCMITTSGELARFTAPITMDHAHELLHADALDTVILEDRKHVMLVDDHGVAKGLPVNVLATRHYHAKCGAVVPWQILGPVLIVPDADYIKDEALRGMYE